MFPTSKMDTMVSMDPSGDASKLDSLFATTHATESMTDIEFENPMFKRRLSTADILEDLSHQGKFVLQTSHIERVRRWRIAYLVYLLLSLAAGCVTMYASIIFQGRITLYEGIIKTHVITGQWFFILIGPFVIMTAGIALFCLHYNKHATYIIAATCMVCMFLLEVIAVLYGAAMFHQFYDELQWMLMFGQKYYGDDISHGELPSVTSGWDKIQTDFGCCGIYDPSDWTHYYGNGSSVPDSCCKLVMEDCGAGQIISPDGLVYPEGCHDLLLGFLIDTVVDIMATTGGVAVWQLIGSLFGWILAAQWKAPPTRKPNGQWVTWDMQGLPDPQSQTPIIDGLEDLEKISELSEKISELSYPEVSDVAEITHL